MIVKLIEHEKIAPPPTVSIELTEEEAAILRTIIGSIGRNYNGNLYTDLLDPNRSFRDFIQLLHDDLVDVV